MQKINFEYLDAKQIIDIIINFYKDNGNKVDFVKFKIKPYEKGHVFEGKPHLEGVYVGFED